jgi:hypothetical protein
MTPDELEREIGGPPGDYVQRLWAVEGGGVPDRRDGRAAARYAYWATRPGHLSVGFAEDGTACTRAHQRLSVVREPTFLERLFGGDVLIQDD